MSRKENGPTVSGEAASLDVSAGVQSANGSQRTGDPAAEPVTDPFAATPPPPPHGGSPRSTMPVFPFQGSGSTTRWSEAYRAVKDRPGEPSSWPDDALETLASRYLQHPPAFRESLAPTQILRVAFEELQRRLVKRHGAAQAEEAIRTHEAHAQTAEAKRKAENDARNEATANGQGDEYKRLVRRELVRLRARQEAQEILRREDAAARRGDLPPADPVSLADALAEGVPETRWRIEGLLKADATCVLSGPYKGGKSLLVAELVRSLADGDPYLDHFPVLAHEGRVMVVDTEQGRAELLEVLAARGIRRTDRVDLVDTSGIVGDWDLTIPENMDRAVTMLQEGNVSALVFDPLAPLFIAMGVDENDADAQKPLEAFNELKRRAGLDVVILTHHSGHGGGGRARGSSAISGWPSVLWDMSRDGEGFDARRFLTAKGRGVGVPLGELVLGEDNRLRFVPETEGRDAKRLAERTAADTAHRGWILERIEKDPEHSARHYTGLWEAGTTYAVNDGDRVVDVRVTKNRLESTIKELLADGWLKDVGTASRPALVVVPEQDRPPRLHNPAKGR